MKFVMFKKSLEEGVSPIYLFDGEEEYFKERGEDMLKERYLSEPSLNYTSFNGDNLKGSEMISLVRAAESFPFLSEKRLVKAVDFYPTEKEYESYLKSYFENPQESTILLIMNSRAPKGKVMDLKKIKTVTHVDCSKADDETVMRWIFTQFKRAGISVDAECCERIARYCLSDMSRVAGETEKLKAYALQGGVITAQVVDDVVYRDTDYKMYELTGAIARKNYTTYLSVMNELLAKGVDEMNILNGVCNYFRTLFEIVAMGRSDADTANLLGQKEYFVKKQRQQAMMMSKQRVKDCYLSVFNAINDVKNGKISQTGALLCVNAAIFFGA